MKLWRALILTIALAACAGSNMPINADFSAPTSPDIARSLALRDRYNAAKHIGGTAIFVDSVAVHHVHAEASTIVWKDETGMWQWSRVSEVGPGGLLEIARHVESNQDRPLTATESKTLDRLIADSRLYSGKMRTNDPTGVGAAGHVMSIVTPFGRTTLSWDGRLKGVSGQIADIVLGKG